MKKKIIAALAVCLSLGVCAANWTYAPSAKTISDGDWTFKATVSGTDLTVGTPVDDTDPSQCPTEVTTLDFSKPVIDGSDPTKQYTIVELSPCFGPYSGSARASKDFVGALTLPGEGLKKIGDCAFRNCSNLAGDLVFPTTLTNMLRGAFMGTQVTSADFKAANAELKTGYSTGAFQYCTELKWVRFAAGGSFTAPNGCLFPGCTALGDADLSGIVDVAISGDNHYPVFLNCSALTNVTLSSDIVITNKGSGTIGNTLFKNNAKLATIRFTGAAPDELQNWIDGDGGYLGIFSSSQTITTYVLRKCLSRANVVGMCWLDYANDREIKSKNTTWASDYLPAGVDPSVRPLLAIGAQGLMVYPR